MLHARIALQVNTLALVMMLVLRALQVHIAVLLLLHLQVVVLFVPLVSPLLARVHKEVTPQCALSALRSNDPDPLRILKHAAPDIPAKIMSTGAVLHVVLNFRKNQYGRV